MDQESNQNSEIEVKLIANGPPPLSQAGQNGPVFESGPGWGAKTKNWLGRYFWKVIFPIAIIILVGYGISTRDESEQTKQAEEPAIIAPETISQSIKPGDSRTVLARRALAVYLANSPAETFSAGQKVFIETKLARTVTATVLKTGGVINFGLEDIKNFAAQAKGLNQFQLQKWENYARSVRF